MLGKHLVDLAVLDWLFAYHFLKLIIGKLAHHDHAILNYYSLTIKTIFSEHSINCPLPFSPLPALSPRPKNIISIQFSTLHRPVRAEMIRNVDISSMESVPTPLA